MYSIVLATMLTTGTANTPQWLFHCHGCHSCHGCHGCHSCRGCHGCCSGCCGGWSCSGCCGGWSCSGCCGGFSCSGCHGGCTGYACYGWATAYGCYGYLGCGGYGGGVASGAAYYGGRVDTHAMAAPAPVSGGHAKVVVQVPGDVQVYAEGQRVQIDPVSKSFRTPTLTAGAEYEYTLKAETIQGGRTRTETKTVRVRAGQTTTVAFDNLRAPAQAVAEESARITVNLPEKARLYVNGVLWTARSFDTPALPRDRSYSYTLRAEVDQNGQTLKADKKVVFKAGEKVTVEFESLVTTE